MKLRDGMRILFQGDSITDCCRDRSDAHSLAGYTAMIADGLGGRNIECFNRGVSGHRTSETLIRMEADCAQTKPDLITILLGINDTWRRFDSNLPTTAEEFGDNYRRILDIAKKFAPQIVVFEPFLIPLDPSKAVFRMDLDPKIQVLRSVVRPYAADYIPLDGIFAEKGLHLPLNAFTDDGVHPNEAGQRLIAEEFFKRAEN